MASIIVTTPVTLNNIITHNADTDVLGKTRMMIRTSDNKIRFGVPIAPREINYSDWGRTWEEIPRDGLSSYLVQTGYKNPKISFTTVLASHMNPTWDITIPLRVLKDLSNSTVPIKITYGGFFESNYSWRLTNFSFSSVYRHPTTNAITQADVDLEFTMMRDVTLKTGPVKGGK